MQAGVEPLRRVGGCLLRREHVAEFVIEGARIGFRIEIAALPAPIGPGAGHPVEHLLGRTLAHDLVAGGFLAPQPFRHAVLGNRLQLARYARLAEIFLGQHVARHLAPRLGNLDVVLLENHRSVGVTDLALGGAERNALIG